MLWFKLNVSEIPVVKMFPFCKVRDIVLWTKFEGKKILDEKNKAITLTYLWGYDLVCNDGS